MNGNVSLYFHIPFCTKKCPYCHFYVVPDKQEFKDKLLKGLRLEWQRWNLSGKKVVSVYFGGGTPFLFGAGAIEEIVSWTKCSGEITLEANPENVTFEAMRAYRDAGINRVSIGVQSLDDGSLEILGRTHHAKKALSAIEDTYKSGIKNISIDLMYDLPHQSLESWQRTLDQIEALPIKHLSLYNLTIEPHTAFHKQKKHLSLPSSELSLAMLETGVSHFKNIGLKRYEISAFAKEGYHSIHNTGYWEGRPFLGFGPSAFSYWEGKRFRNICNLNKYYEFLDEGKSPVDFEEELPYPKNFTELFAVELRMLKGVDLHKFAHMPEDFFKTLESLKQKKLITIHDSKVCLTSHGLLFYDSVASEIL